MISSSFTAGIVQLEPPYDLVPKVYYPIFGVQQVRLNVHKIESIRLIRDGIISRITTCNRFEHVRDVAARKLIVHLDCIPLQRCRRTSCQVPL